MKNLIAILLASLLFYSSAGLARDDIAGYSVEETLALEQSKEALGSDIRFYFGDQVHGPAIRQFGEFGTNKKTNAFNKTDKEACQWVFLSAMLALRDRALREGGNAVINIKSNYKGNLTTSNEEFQCGAGAFVAGVALLGDVVEIER